MKRHVSFLLIFAFIAQPVWADSKTELESLRERLQQLQQAYQRNRESSAEATDALKQSERAISESGRKLYQLEREQRATQAAAQAAGTEAEQTGAQIRQRQARLAEMLRQAYMRGGGDALKLMLNGQNPSQAARDLHYLSHLSRAQTRLIEELRQDLARLADLRQAAAAKDRALAEIRAAQLQERENLLKEKQARQKVLDKLAGEIRKQRKEIATLRHDEQRLADLVAQLAKMAAKRPAKKAAPAGKAGASGSKPVAVNTQVPEPGREGAPFSRLKGLLRLPVAGELMNRFGTPREDGGLSWKGLFIRAAAGSEVRAVAGGTVAFSDWLRGFGNLLIIDHGEGYMSLYSNNESLYKQAGDAVKTGEAIASVGNSGGQESPGVYFELRHQSRPINPMAWIK